VERFPADTYLFNRINDLRDPQLRETTAIHRKMLPCKGREGRSRGERMIRVLLTV
jgi:hypothetical protein